MIASSLVQLHPGDNVAIARRALNPGEPFDSGRSTLTRVPGGHKIAIAPILGGTAVIKYGQIIGFAARNIEPGEHVHTENVVVGDAVALHHVFGADAIEPSFVPTPDRDIFLGYRRADGRVGTRNYIALIVSVNCSATVARAVADHFTRSGELDDHPAIDGVVALTHNGGCGVNLEGASYRVLTRTLAGYAIHPNVIGTLMIGLGCETNQIDHILDEQGLSRSGHLRTMTIQEMGGTRKTIDAAIDAVRDMLRNSSEQRRTVCDASHLTLALECGGSDGFSGLSANPALGYATDLLVRQGGTAVLSETPEISGGEHLLTRRAKNSAVAEKLLDRVAWWREHAKAGGGQLNDNPSHGNREGGITTITEKSLGAIAKAGTTRLNAVYDYAEPIGEHGLVFMDTPGYDPMAVTGQVAGGCTIVCFTTGRGSTAGYKPAPCLKLATNTPMFQRMADDMDLDCGGIITGEDTIEEVGQRIFRKVLATASGEKTVSESQNYGDNEFVPWQFGPTM